MAGRENDRVRFDFVLSAKTEYRVIPIEQQPVRLAIDLQNAQSNQISKTVNIRNVKTIRGGNNSASVYRIVFDLDYLKHFSVQAKDNLLQVEFFDEPAADATVPALAQNQKTATEAQSRGRIRAENRCPCRWKAPGKDAAVSRQRPRLPKSRHRRRGNFSARKNPRPDAEIREKRE